MGVSQAASDCGMLDFLIENRVKMYLSCAGAADVVGSVVNPEGNHNAEADGELLERDQRTANLWGCHFGVVHGDDHGE